jgi:hypothetical protein
MRLREPILGDGSRAIELVREDAADISRALGYDNVSPSGLT